MQLQRASDPTAGSGKLLPRVEELFEDSESIVIAAFQAQKISHSADSTGSQLLKALGGKQALSRDLLRPVVIVFTVKRSLTDRGFQASIHFARPLLLGQGGSKGSHDGDGNPRLELRKTYPLKSLHDMRISSATRHVSGSGAEALIQQQSEALEQLKRQQLIELRCASHHSLPEHRAQYLMSDMHVIMFFASLVVQLLRHQDAVLPTVSGIPMERLDAWWSSHKEEVTAGLSTFALEVVTPGAIMVGRAAEASGCVLLSDKEASELEELLAGFDMELGESEAFAAALQVEAAALESANVCAILESGPMVEGVLAQLKHTQAVLDDLDESLKVFDFKLHHMRDDIAAIEASNNTLERQARHNTALMNLLEQLLGGLGLDRELTNLLTTPNFRLDRLPKLVSAAWQLHAKRMWLAAGSADSLNPLLTQMRLVKEAQLHLRELASRFVSQAVSFMAGLVGQLMGEAMAETSRHGNRCSKVSPPNRSRQYDVLLRCRPLVQVVAVLDHQSVQRLQQQVCGEVNALLRREVRAAAGELRRGVTAELSSGLQAGEGDYSLIKEGKNTAGGTSQQPGKRIARISYGSGSNAGSDSVSDWTADPSEFVNTGSAAAGVSAAKRQAFLDGSANSLPLHEAWSLLLSGFLPFLADEAAFYADLLLLYRDDDERLRTGPAALGAAADADQPQPPLQRIMGSHQLLLERPADCQLTYAGVQAVEAMMSGLDIDFVALADLAARSHQVLLLPLLAMTYAWRQRLDCQPHAAPLVAMLGALAEKLKSHWGAFMSAQVAAVEQYDSRSKMGLQQGIKHIHVLPFISQFCLLAHDLEVALAEGLAAAVEAEDPPTVVPDEYGDDGEAAAAAAAAARRRAEQEAAVAAAARIVRADADAMYDELCPRLLARLERVAASDAKYAERCRLENYAFMGEALRSLAQRLPALQQHWQVAESRHEGALAAYVQDQLEYSKFWKLLEFGNRLDKLLKVVSPPEVPFQKDCSAAELRSLMRSTMDGTDKKLESMVARVRKHLGGGSLFNIVWASIKDHLLQRYEHLESLLEECYPTTPLRPSPEELRELFRATSAG